jgi:hypothetical protein
MAPPKTKGGKPSVIADQLRQFFGADTTPHR